jgi:hypothetical protein
MSIIFKILYAFVSFINGIIFVSFLTTILNANEGHPFVIWVNDMSLAFTQPFENILAENLCIDRFCFALTPIVAFVFYSILGFILSELAKTFSRTK